MFNTRIVSLLLLVSNNLNNFLSSDSDSIYIKLKDINSGYDQRCDITSDERVNSTILYEIKRNMIHKNIIEELENNNTSIHKKLDIIEKYTDIYKKQKPICEFNLFAGNLMNDFNSSFDT